MTTIVDPAEPALTLLTGPAGIGRSHALRGLREAAAAAGRPVVEVRLAPEDRDEPWYLAGRVLAGLAPIPTRLGAGRGGFVEPPAAALTRALRRHPGLVIVVDDAQWADPESATALLAALHQLARTPVRCVAAWRTGAAVNPVLLTGFDGLRAAGLAKMDRLRPLPPAEADALVFRLLQAVPHDSLRTELRRLSRGRPGPLLAAVEGYRGSDTLRVVDRRAYLADVTVPPRIPVGHDLLRPVHRLDPGTFAVARSLAVLEPLGPAVPALIGRALGMTSDEVGAHLGTLRDEGVARVDRRGWRIPVPAVAVALGAGLGPYERRRLAQVAVQALWSGDAHSGDPGFLPDAVATAGGLVDPARSITLLREHATAAALRSPADAARWWSGAADLSGDPADRAEAVLNRAGAELRAGRYGSARTPLLGLLSENDLSPAAREEAALLALIGARGERDMDAVRATASGECGGPVTRAAALTVLDRWAEAARLIRETARITSTAEALGTQIRAVTGRTSATPRPHPGTGDSDAGSGRRAASAAVTAFLTATVSGDPVGAHRALAGTGLTDADLPVPARALRDWRAGRWDRALEAALFGVAADLAVAYPVAQSTVHRMAAEVLLARGWPSRARAMLETARADGAPLPHLLEPVAAEIDQILGDPAAAARVTGAALAETARRGLVAGVDELWLTATELAMERGDPAEAAAAADAAAGTAAALDTVAARLRAASARLVADRNPELAGEVVSLAREFGAPYELARALERVVRWTGHTPALLGEAYDLLGDLGAVLHRSRVRQAMREHGLAVPGRSETLAEGEQLLAALVAEGLSNRQLAAATQSSEKSVEGRLSRLFNRTGYRSRVELASAVLVGEYQVG
ncbi:regulatory protein, luxR family [Actinoplanes derwentensis]|uniref:Regulatory protein, luxR family n=2 Tax=Actinoplanes derwentensis TaxID=113562 RepID=A0A1H2C8E7_9ACTN|nr:LuxR family transcriptional regulator [Actinoplanes derwentensis]SDT66609.1 regulatory protein, luxR family [Actinoplanes derwentensis]